MKYYSTIILIKIMLYACISLLLLSLLLVLINTLNTRYSAINKTTKLYQCRLRIIGRMRRGTRTLSIPSQFPLVSFYYIGGYRNWDLIWHTNQKFLSYYRECCSQGQQQDSDKNDDEIPKLHLTELNICSRNFRLARNISSN